MFGEGKPQSASTASDTDFAQFRSHYEAGRSQCLIERMLADLETPVSLYLKLGKNERYAFLLESVEGGAIRGRYSILGFDPDLIWESKDGKTHVHGDDAAAIDRMHALDSEPLAALRQLSHDAEIDVREGLPPSAAALVGYLGYDMVRHYEHLGQPAQDDLALPDGIFVRPRLLAIFDAVDATITFAVPVRPQTGLSAEEAFDRARGRLRRAGEQLSAGLSLSSERNDAPYIPTDWQSNTTTSQYKSMVERAQEYIAAGDIFQVVLSQRFSAFYDLPPFELYRSLRRTNPSPYMYFLKFNDLAIVGSSPEILVRLRGEEVTIRPIAGTRRRGKSPEEDALLAEDLLSDPKELAEHLMLLDLGRNDVGRVADPTTVRVTARNTVEYYSHVMHIVSNVVGQLAKGRDAIDALFAGFPAGTVSGAPKIRAMQIIDELELSRRSVYAGAVGYFGADGSMDSCIVLRTAIVTDGEVHVQAGAGIVADSDPLAEQRECEAKAGALFAAVEDAKQRAREQSS
ncbi:MAG: anthranilate synthase component I [Pseudomonadota bacterium]